MTTHSQAQARKVGIHPNHNENDLYGQTIGRKTVNANMYAIQQENAKYFAFFIPCTSHSIVGQADGQISHLYLKPAWM